MNGSRADVDAALTSPPQAPTLEVSPAELFALIGEQHVEIRLLRARVAHLSALVAELSAKKPQGTRA